MANDWLKIIIIKIKPIIKLEIGSNKEKVILKEVTDFLAKL